jgi:hypothetical protein
MVRDYGVIDMDYFVDDSQICMQVLLEVIASITDDGDLTALW